MSPRFPSGYRTYHPDPNLNYQLNRFLGGEPETEVCAAAAKIRDLQDWTSETLAQARAADREGRRASAVNWYRAATFFMSPGDPEKDRTSDRSLELFWEEHAGDAGTERVGVPYEGRLLHAIRLGTSQPRGTIVVHSGFDSFIEEFYEAGRALRDSGFDVVLFDGPGQGTVLAKEKLPMTAAWEKPVAAVLDHFELRDVTLVGLSLGGYLAPRAAAFEPRVARVVAFDVLYDFFEVVVAHGGAVLAASAKTLLSSRATASLLDAAIARLMARDLTVSWGVQQGMLITGAARPSEFLQRIRQYTVAEISPRITQDFLLLAGQEDHYVPIEQFYRQARALTGVRSLTTRLFTRAEQAQNHCQFGNLDLALRVIADWIHERTDSVRSR